MDNRLVVKRVAVLGAGVMGAQIAAHCVNAGIDTRLYDLTLPGKPPNALLDKAVSVLTKLSPSPLATPQTAQLLKLCNYEEHLSELGECQLIIEAIAERLDWKEELYQRISPFLAPDSVLVSNTSGLSINRLVAVLPEQHHTRFCGVHFFNPPRYMHLVEIIPSDVTNPMLLDDLETWLTGFLGKGVVRAFDTPNFIANRIGVFSLLVTLHYAKQFNLGLDTVDALTGTYLGRPKSATFRTMDVVGLDTLSHVVNTMQNELANDPWHALFQLPDWMHGMIEAGHLGQKTGQGVTRKQGPVIEVYDVETKGYRPAITDLKPAIKQIMQIKEPTKRMQALLDSPEPEARFIVACYRELFHYCAVHNQTIASNVRDVDAAMRWGFGWQQGPFETWQAFGCNDMTQYIIQSMANQTSLTQATLPEWVLSLSGFYEGDAGFSPRENRYESRRALPVYLRQNVARQSHPVVYENAGVRLVSLEEDVLMVSFKSKANTIGQAVLDGLFESVHLAEEKSQGLIIYQHDASQFSLGADLREVSVLLSQGKIELLDEMLISFQQAASRLKYSSIPVVAAFEAYPGLVEVGVGLIPGAGGCKEFTLRAAGASDESGRMQLLQRYFEQIATAFVASSAPEALQRGFLKPGDDWVMHTDEVLYAAIARIKAMQATNYTPPLSAKFPVTGRTGLAVLQTGLVNWLEGGFISAHDYFIANELAFVLCGGQLTAGELVDEAWLLRLEREAFIKLASTPLSQARIKHTLETGKPLRN
ncbi:MAG: 3-hydroxyacyl-CoA dehydrogenase [Legionella sp. 21-45-4]|nr:MAG: 3-hydroxyacyl-CoA dehydrogenase [Legionella sp. 21-45-4]